MNPETASSSQTLVPNWAMTSASTRSTCRLSSTAWLSATNARRRVVTSVPQSQRYYWTPAWQENERIAVAELERGEGRQFGSGAEAAEWLLSDED